MPRAERGDDRRFGRAPRESRATAAVRATRRPAAPAPAPAGTGSARRSPSASNVPASAGTAAVRRREASRCGAAKSSSTSEVTSGGIESSTIETHARGADQDARCRLPVNTPSGMPMRGREERARETPSSAVLPARSRTSAPTGRRKRSDSPKSKPQAAREPAACTARRSGRSKPRRCRSCHQHGAGRCRRRPPAARSARAAARPTTRRARAARQTRCGGRRTGRGRCSRFVFRLSGTAALPRDQRGWRSRRACRALHSSCGICGAGCGLTTRRADRDRHLRRHEVDHRHLVGEDALHLRRKPPPLGGIRASTAIRFISIVDPPLPLRRRRRLVRVPEMELAGAEPERGGQRRIGRARLDAEVDAVVIPLRPALEERVWSRP